MKKYSDENNINESLEDKFKDKITEQYKSLKRGIISLLENSVENKDELVNVQNFMDSYIKNSDKVTLIGFVDDAEVFDFYLKYQSTIDEICTDKKYFEKIPQESSIISLYGYVINGTKYAVMETMKIMLSELF